MCVARSRPEKTRFAKNKPKDRLKLKDISDYPTKHT
jgi:hypothetical protein